MRSHTALIRGSISLIRTRAALAVTVLAIAAVIGACQNARSGNQPARDSAAPAAAHDTGTSVPHSGSVDRGRYLVAVTGCSDCHTPFKLGSQGPEPDLTRRLAGHPQELKMPPAPKLGDSPWVWVGSGTNTAFAGPWGVSYAANLTPDQQTGMGIWTEGMFVKAMRTGRHFGEARPIQPPMPWQCVGQMTDDDLKSIYAYLRTIPAVKNQVPEYAPPG